MKRHVLDMGAFMSKRVTRFFSIMLAVMMLLQILYFRLGRTGRCLGSGGRHNHRYDADDDCSAERRDQSTDCDHVYAV